MYDKSKGETPNAKLELLYFGHEMDYKTFYGTGGCQD
jgi:hypothetical protein